MCAQQVQRRDDRTKIITFSVKVVYLATYFVSHNTINNNQNKGKHMTWHDLHPMSLYILEYFLSTQIHKNSLLANYKWWARGLTGSQNQMISKITNRDYCHKKFIRDLQWHLTAFLKRGELRESLLRLALTSGFNFWSIWTQKWPQSNCLCAAC